MAEQVYLTAVIPAFNEQESITDCVLEVRQVLKEIGRPFELLVVDDGSTDGTLNVLRHLKPTAPELRVVSFARNRGQTAAMAAGFDHARGELVVTLDADQQNDPRDIPALLEHMDRFDVVCGVRAKRRDNAVRRFSSRLANGIRNRLTRENISDTGCTLKIFRTAYLRKIRLFEGMHRFLPTLLRLEGARVTEAPVNHRPRTKGTAKYGVWNRLFKSARDLLAVRWMKARHVHYEVQEEID
jgi:glycosyltransferase involved in cell wall biosynthesis